MVATARPAITASRSVTARLGLRENAGCESQHQNEAQQGRMNSLHGNLLLKITFPKFGDTHRQVPGRFGTSQIRRTRIRTCRSVRDGYHATAAVSIGPTETTGRSCPMSGRVAPASLASPCSILASREHTGRSRSYLIADISSVRICYGSKMDGRRKREMGN